MDNYTNYKQSNSMKITENNDRQQIGVRKQEMTKHLVNEQNNKDYYELRTTSVGLLKLFMHLSNKTDILIIVFGVIGSLGAGTAMPVINNLVGRAFSSYKQAIVTNTFTDEVINSNVRNFFIVGAIVFISYFLLFSCWTFVGMRHTYKMKKLYFLALLKQEQAFYDYNNAFEFSTKFQTQTKEVENGLGIKLGILLMMISQATSSLIVSFTNSWALSLIALAVVMLMIICTILLELMVKSNFIMTKKSYEKAGGVAEEVLHNMKTIASFANYIYEKQRFKKLIQETKDLGIKYNLKYAVGLGVISFCLYFSYTPTVYVGSRFIIENVWNYNAGRNFLGGDLNSVIFPLAMLITSFGGVIQNLKAVNNAVLASSDYFSVHERKSRKFTNECFTSDCIKDITGKIEFKDVFFSYPLDPEKQVLKGVNLIFQPGEKNAIIGESGSGKSTIINLLERFYEPDSGKIQLDGCDLRNFNLDYLRSIIGYVEQEPVLLNRSIKENIIFGRENLANSKEELDKLLQEACDNAYVTDFLNLIPGKLNYVVGIRGSKLSGGQKQRIAIARALFAQPKILLLDEATSALDNDFENFVQKAIDYITTTKKITTIIVAHRFSAIKYSDKIWELKNGIVYQKANHEVLNESKENYPRLAISQLNNNEFKMSSKILLSECNVVGDLSTDKKIMHKNIVQDKQGENIFDLIENVSFKNKIISQVSTEDINTSIKKPIKLKKLFSFLKSNKCDIALAIFGSAFVGCLAPMLGYVLASTINMLSNSSNEKVLEGGVFSSLMFLTLAVVAGMATLIQTFEFKKIGEVLSYKLRKAVFLKYLFLNMEFFDIKQNSSGALLTKLSTDTTLLNSLILTVIGVPLQIIVCFFLGFGITLAYEWRFALIGICFLPWIIIAGYYMMVVNRGVSTSLNENDLEVGSNISECLINTKTVYSYNFQEKAVELLSDDIYGLEKNFFKQCVINALLLGIGNFSRYACTGIFLYAGGKFILNGSLILDNLTIAFLSFMISSIGVGSALFYLNDFDKAATAFTSIFSILDLNSNIIPEKENMKQSADKILGKIEFRDVSFAYPSSPQNFVLKSINFTIEPGKSVAFVGHSGSGKSTIISLLEKFYDLEQGSGEILIDGVNIKKYNIISLRNQIGLVSQEPYIFKKLSVKDNIKYGNLNATDKQVQTFAEKANISKYFKNQEEDKKETEPSGGEKQRIAIARALIKFPKILLFDEATSALDKKSEIEVLKALNQMQIDENITTVKVAHRMDTIENCDMIYVLENGKIVEKGTHHELYARGGSYYNLNKFSFSK